MFQSAHQNISKDYKKKWTKVQQQSFSAAFQSFSVLVCLVCFLSRFVRSLLEEPEVAVMGAAQGPAGSIIHRMFVSAQRVGASLRVLPVKRILLKEQKE